MNSIQMINHSIAITKCLNSNIESFNKQIKKYLKLYGKDLSKNLFEALEIIYTIPYYATWFIDVTDELESTHFITYEGQPVAELDFENGKNCLTLRILDDLDNLVLEVIDHVDVNLSRIRKNKKLKPPSFLQTNGLFF